MVVITHLAPWAILLCSLTGLPWLLAATAAMKFAAALELLHRHALAAARHLEMGRLEEARREAGEIVRRPLDSASPGAVASAAIESIAENLVDGYTGPLTYYPLLGPLGSMLHRLANTLDAALGYRTPEYLRVGSFSAHMDTLLNLAPARLTAILVIALAPLAGGSARGAFRAWLAWRGATPSVNGGHTIAAMAGALGVRLWKEGVYTVNPGGREPGARDVARAVRLSRIVAAAYLAITIAAVSAAAWAAS